MKLLLLLFFFFVPGHFAQTEQVNFYSLQNIRRFADNLFCERDYLRAALEYERLLKISFNDTLYVKTAISYSIIREYLLADKFFSELPPSSKFYDLSRLERMKLFFLQSDFTGLQRYFIDSLRTENNKLFSGANKLFNVSLLLSGADLLPKDEFLLPFQKYEEEKISSFYESKKKPPYKNPALAGILSTIIPGSGKIYTGEIGDGIVGFLTSAIFSFIAYDSFKAGHNTRGWVWTGVAAFFYAGNIYGSVAAAQIHNAKITFEFNEGLYVYLNSHNYFIPEYDFCK
jgi:TM2 domain-containing membrane protein YozV